ncbi:MAG: hypothetical protein CMM92_06820 [Rickettsiales bacterium]|nr:hypothetical protein [Rickettsiales bacterium]RPG12561.1 MAG: hypothetical protein CBD55_006760 [Pelagibacteraceae bacterium TMED195]|tara:strand:+ start:1941 stop:2726 length:786 start_codon:yes stop_codon:yes gene_type:complete
MIHFIVATSSESKLIIKKLKLKKIQPSSGFDFFYNDNFSMTITGLGKINSALGVAHTFFKFKNLSNNIWINIGLAGHEKEKIGTLILVDKIYDDETKKSMYPFFIKDYKIKKLNCTCYAKPNLNYDKSLSDMESSGFFLSANKYSTKELIHSLKIISDNKYDKIDFNNTKNIERLFEKNFDQIMNFILDIKGLWERKFEKQNKIKIKIEKDLKNLKYTFSEGVQIRNLLKIYYNSNYSKKIIEQNKSTKDNIFKIKKILKL